MVIVNVCYATWGQLHTDQLAIYPSNVVVGIGFYGLSVMGLEGMTIVS